MANVGSENIPLEALRVHSGPTSENLAEDTHNAAGQTIATVGSVGSAQSLTLTTANNNTEIPLQASGIVEATTPTQVSSVLSNSLTPPPAGMSMVRTNGQPQLPAQPTGNGHLVPPLQGAANPESPLLSVAPVSTVRRRRKTIWTLLWSMKGPILLLVIYVVTTSIIFTASDLNGPLAQLGVTYGFLVLNVLALLNNYALVAAGDKAWEFLQWGPLLVNGQDLTTFLALSTSSGMGGWLRILCRGLGSSLAKWLWWRSEVMATRPESRNAHGTSTNSITQSRMWSGSRVLFWLLIQFPGLIFMTQVNPKLDYLPTNWEPISGGIGKYNATVAGRKTSNGPLLSGLVINMLRDATITKSVPAISKDCLESRTCISYIIPGGMKSMTPWRFPTENGSSLPIYVTRHTPVYQVDFWDTQLGVKWASEDCHTFGVPVDNGDAFQLCIWKNEKDQIVTGWRFCSDNVTVAGDCTSAGSWGTSITWSTFVSIYRRNATVASNRKTGLFVDVQELTDAEPQNITISELLTAFNGILYTWKPVSFECEASGPDSMLTIWITGVLKFSQVAVYFTEPREFLRNLFMVPLYLYNPLMDGFGASSIPSPDEVVKGLPSENYINGSYAHEVNHLTISQWTAITYAAVCGFLLLTILLILAATAAMQVQETSDYPVVDFTSLRKKPSGNSEGGSESSGRDNIGELFTACALGDSAAILLASKGVRIESRREIDEENPDRIRNR